MKHISRTVWVLSLVSLFTDMAGEMLYPIMPIYLRSIGFSIFIIGVVEGVVDAIAGLGKSYFGKLSDNMGKRLPFVQLGYSLSALSKPLMAIFTFPLWVFFVRSIDKVGKGIRTGARDALLSAEATPETKATIFGFHRSMDTFGAIIGPLFALLFLSFFPNNYKLLFVLALFPGLCSVVASFYLKEKYIAPVKNSKASFFSFIHYWKDSPTKYKKLVVGLLIFSFINSSDFFLLLQAKAAGISDTKVISLYVFYNLIYALAAYPIGLLADKIGFKKVLLSGFFIFSIVYFLFGLTSNVYYLILAFLLYGIYAAATEGVSKAWITNISDKKDIATAIGTFGGFQSIAALLASSFGGFIWYRYGATTMFIFSAIGALLAIVYLVFFNKKSD